MTIGERIKRARNSKGLTQKQLGEVSETSEITIRQYELGKRQPRIEPLTRIASALGTSLYELVGDDYFSSHSQKELSQMWGEVPFTLSARERVNTALGKLNDAGMEKAADAVEIIAEVPRYKAAGSRQEPPQSTPAPTEGKGGYHLAPDAPETPPEDS